MVQFLFEFEAYFDQFCRDIDLKKTYITQLEQTKEVMTVAWDLSMRLKKRLLS